MVPLFVNFVLLLKEAKMYPYITAYDAVEQGCQTSNTEKHDNSITSSYYTGLKTILQRSHPVTIAPILVQHTK